MSDTTRANRVLAAAGLAIVTALTLSACADISEGTDSQAERGIVSDVHAAKTLLEGLAAQAEGPLTAQSLLDGQVVGVLAITQEERDTLVGGGERVAFAFASEAGTTTVDVFVGTTASTSQGLSQATTALYGCTRLTLTAGEATSADIDCPAWLPKARISGGTEVSVDELSAKGQ